MIRLIVICLLIFSCAKEEFKAPENFDIDQTGTRQESSDYLCAGSHKDRPPVDLLFIWDNTSSSSFINDQTKTALNSLVANIEDRFDYNVMMVPLHATGNNGAYFFSADNSRKPSGVTTISTSSASSVITNIGNYPSSGSAENGAQRSIDILASNQTNGIFRRDAYTIIVLMSNGDDTSFIDESAAYNNPGLEGPKYAKAKAHDLLCLRGYYDTTQDSLHNSDSTYNSNCSNAPNLDSSMMRFVSISSLFDRNSCNVTKYLRPNIVYKNMSIEIHNRPYTNGFTFPASTSSNAEEGLDVFNLCRGNFSSLFDGVNNAITDATIAHSYRYWRLAETNDEVDESTIEVTLSNGKTLEQIPNTVSIVRDTTGFNDRDSNGNEVNGYRVIQNPGTYNRRFLPTAGESFTGKVIELFGEGKVTFPSCVTVNYKEPSKYYGYVHLNGRPVESTIKLWINGNLIPESSTNGWQLVKEGGSPKYVSHQNLLIESPTNRSEKKPGEYKDGYFLQVFGTAVHSNSTNIQYTFEPLAN